MCVRVELQYGIGIRQFNGCNFRFNDKTDCFEIYRIKDIRCYTTIVAMFPKESVIGIYYHEEKKE
jgi:hypothetical protein